jgi:hypothetical protein
MPVDLLVHEYRPKVHVLYFDITIAKIFKFHTGDVIDAEKWLEKE